MEKKNPDLHFVPLMNNFLEDLKKIEQRGCNDNSIADLGNLIRYVYEFSKRVELNLSKITLGKPLKNNGIF